MGLNQTQITSVEATIKTSLRNRFENYNPEPAVMPFHTRLLGKDRLVLYAFIHSLNTNFGITIFQPIAASLAKSQFKEVKLQIESGTKISSDAQLEIQKIIDNLTTATTKPDKKKEIEIIRKVAQRETAHTVKLTTVDIFLKSNKDKIYLIDIKTAKPNKGGFKEFKRTLLEWTAAVLFEHPNTKINTLIAIPYNPYEPKPYSRWTMAGMLDLNNELKVSEGFWGFLGGKGAYTDLLDCFERVGTKLRDEIEEYFKRFDN